ncbi:MAG: nitronate monooxygenase family protein [Candidatus Shapirobacteria bacterium]
MERLQSLTFGEYTIDNCIFQGGMSVRISGAELTTAVTKCGGAGTIGGVGRGFGRKEYQNFSGQDADRLALRDELQKAKDIDPDGIWGVNLLVAVTDYEGLVKTAVDNGTKFIVSGAGLPLNLPALTTDYPEIALIPIVSSVQGVRVICERWKRDHKRLPDAIIIEEPATAGGHLGAKFEHINDENLLLKNVIPESRRYLDENKYNIPLIGAGGIWDRQNIDQILEYGASGVQMATRFVCTNECEAPIEFKQVYINSNETIIIRSPVGLPGRAIKTEFLERVKRDEIDDHCGVSCLHRCNLRDSGEDYCIIQALSNVRDGDVKNGVVFAGSNAPRSKEQGIVPVRQIFDELTNK